MSKYFSLMKKRTGSDPFDDENVDIKKRVKNTLTVITLFFSLMWGFYIIDMFFPSLKYMFAIKPREFGFDELIGVLTSWLSHADINHIEGNSLVLATILPFICMIEKKPMNLMLWLIIGSGGIVWVFGSANSIHIGASGVFYACLGYVISACLLGRRWVYLIPIGLSFIYYGTAYVSSFMTGLIPKDEVSFAGHFGGLIIGVVIGVVYNGKLSYYIKIKRS